MLSFDTLTGLIAPVECLGCQREGAIICEQCQEFAGEPPAPRCAGCKALSNDWSTCRSCRSWLPLKRVVVSNHYEGLYEDLVREYKFQVRRDGAEPMAKMMQEVAEEYITENTVLCPMPTAPARIRSRGFDHAKFLTKKLARLSGCEMKSLLQRTSNTRQLGQDRTTRLKQMQSEFTPARQSIAKLPKDAHVIIVDDVMTTGASLAAAAKTLRAAGVKNVSAVVFAQGV